MRGTRSDNDYRYDLRPALQPALLPAVAFAAGVAASGCAPVHALPAATGAALCGALSLAARAWSGRGLAVLACALAGAFGAGAARGAVARAADSERPLARTVATGVIAAGDVVTVEGTVRAAPDTRPGRVRIEIATTSIDAPRTGRMVIGGAVLVSIAGEEPAIGDVGRGVRYGTSVRITGTLDDDLAYQDPGVEPLRNSLIRRGLDASIRARPDGVAITGSGTFCPVLAALFAERERWLAWLDAHFEPRTNGLLRALLLGDGNRLDEETSDVYRRSGTFHVLVISGAHMGIVAVCLLWPVGRMSRGRWLRLAAGAVPVWAYSLMVGLPAPVMRAALAVTIALAARAVHRPAPPANTLALAALAVLAWDPRELDDPGFQLTFAAVAAIVLVAAPVLEQIARAGRWTTSRASPYPPALPTPVLAFARLLFQPVRAAGEVQRRGALRFATIGLPRAVGVAAGAGQRVVRYVLCAVWVAAVVQFALTPLSAAHFHRVTPGGALATCAVEAVLGVVLVVGLAMLVVSGAFPAVAAALAPTVEVLAGAATRTAAAAPDGLFVPAPVGSARFAPLAIAACFAAAAVAAGRWRALPRTLDGLARSRRPIARAALASTAVFVFAWASAAVMAPPDGPPADERLQVVFLDVGQGDAALLTFPDGETMLIDAGGRPRFDPPLGFDGGRPVLGERFDVGERVVCEALSTMGVARLDYVVASHGDADHVGGFRAVLERMHVRSALVAAAPDPHLDAVRSEFVAAGVRLVPLASGDRLRIGGATVAVLWPGPPGGTGNNASLVVRVAYGRRAFLFTGDVERPTERALAALDELGWADLSADVLKVAHHGSHTSSTVEFLAAVRPAWAVVSAPRVSPYGHPHADTVDRLAQSGAIVVQTGRGGAVEFVTDGRTLEAHGLAPDATFTAAVSSMRYPTLREAR